MTLALFCKVIDNFGDIGICWRLARQLYAEHGVAVCLLVDDLVSFQRIAPQVRPDQSMQQVDGVSVRHWHGTPVAGELGEIADIVVEFFGCDIPETYIAEMANCARTPVWLNLEGLTAEKWVEGCHFLPSPHPRFSLTKWFYFPGFNTSTGGLIRESQLIARCASFQETPMQRGEFLQSLGVTVVEAAALTISLFCYPNAPVRQWFAALAGGAHPVTCLVPEGVAANDVEAFLGRTPVPGAVCTAGALTVRVVPFLPQPDYDRLLWACDLNVVRGEDSFVRAQWAGRPFIWHIYPQDQQLHHKKLKAFLDIHAPGPAVVRAMLLWNDAVAGGDAAGDAGAASGSTGEGKADYKAPFSVKGETKAEATADDVTGGTSVWPAVWRDLHADLPAMTKRAVAWRAALLAQDDLATQLLRFAEARQAEQQQKQV